MNNELKILKAHEFQMRNIENAIKKMSNQEMTEDEYMENEEIDEVIERERQEQSE